ncbi:MAG: PKD domain-containing protein [Planctomycetes bacterium]|nr:PKD domain-containing protein [Planctomycetota bacterium]
MALVVLVGVGAAPSVHAQFGSSRVISGGFTGCFEPDLAYRVGDRLSVTFTRAGEIFHTQSGNDFSSFGGVSQSPLQASSEGRVEVTSIILLDVVYAEVAPGGSDTEIYLVDNNGGVFSNPIALTDNALNDRNPQIDVGLSGIKTIAWETVLTPASREIYVQAAGDTHFVALGDHISLASSSSSVAYIAYVRAGEAFYRTLSAGVLGPESQIGTINGVTSIDIERRADGQVDAALSAGNDLYFAAGDGSGGFTAPVSIATATVAGEVDLSPEVAGRRLICYAEAGEVHVLSDEGSGWVLETLTSGASSSDPRGLVDPHGDAHVVWSQSGQIRYAYDGPPPAADFVGGPTTGVLPLTVTFENQSTGTISTTIWDFGDGTATTAPNPVHDYTDVGPHTVTLTVIGPGGTDTFTRTNYVSGTLPPEVLSVAKVSAFAGQNVLHPVTATTTQAMQGFQFGMVFDDSNLEFHGIDFALSATEALSPEFVYTDYTPGGVGSELIVAIVLDFVEPFDGRSIAAGQNILLFSLDYTIDFPLALGTTISFQPTDGLGQPPLDNIYAAVTGVSVHPFLRGGRAEVDGMPGALFRRGDANYDQLIDIGDPIFLLAHFFALGPAPVCPDSGDANDDGMLDIGDAIFDLSFLFSAGSTPPYPFPGVGLDPTDDALGPCAP